MEARPPSVGYRLGKFLKRNKGPVLAASFVLLALVAGFIGTAWGLVRADRARQAEAAQRKIAVEEKTKAEASEALAKAASRAEEREEQAIDAVKKFRDAVANNPELKNNPALEPLRKTLLKEPLAFFKALRDRLQADGDTRPESLDRLAQAGFDLGMLTDEIGDKQDALIGLHGGAGDPGELAEAYPADTRLQSRPGRQPLQHRSSSERETGQLAEALEAYRAARGDPPASWPTQTPDPPSFGAAWPASYNNIGVLLSTIIGKPAEALEALRVGARDRERLADANPAVAEFQIDLAGSHGQHRRPAGAGPAGPAEALKALEAALAIRERLADANPVGHHTSGTIWRSATAASATFNRRAGQACGSVGLRCERALAIVERLGRRTTHRHRVPGATWRAATASIGHLKLS